MAISVACIAGEEIHRQWDDGRINGQKIGSHDTPFGPSGDIFLVTASDQEFYLLPRYGVGMGKPAPRGVNYRANMYALKDLGIQSILAWGPGGAITHTYAIGDLVILSDLIDRTYLRDKTFFENSPLGFLRQFPTFCPTLRKALGEALHEEKLVYHGAGVAAVSEGPRLETPAEIRVLTNAGAEVVTHTFVPELFLAKELQLCYAAVCYVVNYAETGSRHRPFAAGDLFGGLTQQTDADRLADVTGAMCQIAGNVTATLQAGEKTCGCNETMAANIEQYKLPKDWHEWFAKKT